MNFSSWLDAEVGRASRVAEHFAVSYAAVSQWRTAGVPPARMKAVRDLSGGLVTLDEMLPDARPVDPDPSQAQAAA